MARFHVNTNTGESGKCKAKPGNCPLGGDSGEENHYATQEEARQGAESLMHKKYGEVALRGTSRELESDDYTQTAMTYDSGLLSSLGSLNESSDLAGNNGELIERIYQLSDKSHREATGQKVELPKTKEERDAEVRSLELQVVRNGVGDAFEHMREVAYSNRPAAQRLEEIEFFSEEYSGLQQEAKKRGLFLPDFPKERFVNADVSVRELSKLKSKIIEK